MEWRHCCQNYLQVIQTWAMTQNVHFGLWRHFQKSWHMQRIQIIFTEVLLCNVLNAWFHSCLFVLPLFKKQKTHKFLNFSYPGSRKCWPQQNLWCLSKYFVPIWCRTVWSIFVNLWRRDPIDKHFNNVFHFFIWYC